MELDDPELRHAGALKERAAHWLHRQNGLILRRQALEAGLGEAEIQRRLRRGEWVTVRRGVYTTGLRWAGLDDHVERPRLRVLAASLAMQHPHAVSHQSAALLHRLPILMPRPELVHVTRASVMGGRIRHGVKHHVAPFLPRDMLEIDGVWTFSLARTAVGIAREYGARYGLPACDAAMRYGVARSDLWDVVDRMVSWPHLRVMRRCVDQADPDADNPWESLTRLLVLDLGLGRVETQFGITDGGRRAWCDLRIGRHIVEFDGLWKYRERSAGGFAPDGDPHEALVEEKKRQDFLLGFRLGVSRVTASDLSASAWDSTSRRLHAAILDTDQRWGRSIADLAPYLLSKGSLAEPSFPVRL